MSRIRIIGGRGGALRPWLFSGAAESRKAGRPVVLFVPEQYTLQAERDLLTGMDLPGLLDLDVVSPTKLKTLVRERLGRSGRRELDGQGRAMAVHRALHACGNSLRFYGNAGDLYGAVAGMERTLADFRDRGITAETLSGLAETARGGARRAKFHDFSLILQEYGRLLGDRFDDASSAWEDLCARLEAGSLWRGADLYVYGFDTVRPDLRRLILAVSSVCENVSVLLTMTDDAGPAGRIFRVQRESAAELKAALEERGVPCSLVFLRDPPACREPALAVLENCLFSDADASFRGDPAPAVTLYAAAHPTAEAFAVVSVLRAWRREGIPWNRMAVALRGGDSGSLTSVLRMNGIPFFHSRKEPVARHGVSRLLAGALDCVSRGPRTEPLLDAACSGFGLLSREEGARLSRYAALHGIDRGKWRKPFTRGADAEAMEALRLRLTEPVFRLHGALRDARDASASVEAVFRFLQEENVYAQLEERRRLLTERGMAAEAVVDRQVWDCLMNMLDQLWALLGGRKAPLREIARLVSGALERSFLSSLPEEEEGVAVGEIGHMLPGQTEALVLPGMNDGVMSVPPEGLLSDPEMLEIQEKTGRPFGTGPSRMTMMVRSDFYRTMTLPSKRLWVSFRLRDASGAALQPGEPVAELKRIFPGLRQRGGLADADFPLHPETPALALEGLGPRLRKVASGESEDLSPEWRAALGALWRDPRTAPAAAGMLRPLLSPPPSGKIPPETALSLFQGDRVSISRLECFAGCPYKHFLRYGLRPDVREAFDFSAADAGDFFHAALDRYTRLAVREKAWPNLTEERVNRLMDGVLDPLTGEWEDGPLSADALGRWRGEEYVRRVRRAALVLTRFAANSDFRILGTEIGFGGEEGAPPLVLELRDGSRVALQGKIDRLDRYDGPDGSFLRVLDFKSGEKELVPAKMDRGEQLQLMIYLRAALQNHPGTRPAGALYFPVQDPEVKAEDPEAAEEKRIQGTRLKGVAVRDEDVLRAMDRDASPFSLPKYQNKDGSFSKNADWVLDEKLLYALTDAAMDRAAELCGRIRSGEVPVSPSVESDRASACTFCEFAGICSRRKEDGRPLPGNVSFADAAARAGSNLPLRNGEK